jgi:glucose/arabinose dehydrogenase/mono/diheme cytochrome c family protein
VNTSTFSSRRVAYLRAGRRSRRYRHAHPVSVDQRHAPSGFRIALFSFFILPVLFVLCLTSRGLGVKTWLLHATGLAPVRKVIPLASGVADPSIQFEKVALPLTAHTPFTCVMVGPDHRLYAGADDGRIFRYTIAADGTLELPQVITSLQDAQGSPRLLVGICFDPASTPTNPIIWATHGFYAFHDAPDFSGKISRLSGRDLEIVQDVVVGLPRSIRDHTTNQPAFGPDGALYIPQGSNSASGAPDTEWGMRSEHLLNASILRLDVKRVTPGQPIDVRTIDAGGEYNPASAGAPLTIYASGIRNAFDIVWASDGRLYVPVNGSSAGGNAPAGPGVPALQGLYQTEDDWLLRITPGAYYGHPNPAQGHYVLNGANPGNRSDTSVIPEYPVGTFPDPKWRPAILDFGPHVSANGIIEYRGSAFGGKLDHKLIVCRFNMGSDLICIGLNSQGNVNSIQTGIAGFTRLVNPLALTEDRTNGNIYVAEYGAQHIALLRPGSITQRNYASLAGSFSGDSSSGAGSSASLAAQHGRALFSMTCINCHGSNGGGIPYTGANLRQSKWIAEKSDDELAKFILMGRQKSDPNSLLHLTMPPKGGNPNLDNAAVHDVIAYLRELQADARKDAIMD